MPGTTGTMPGTNVAVACHTPFSTGNAWNNTPGRPRCRPRLRAGEKATCSLDKMRKLLLSAWRLKKDARNKQGCYGEENGGPCYAVRRGCESGLLRPAQSRRVRHKAIQR